VAGSLPLAVGVDRGHPQCPDLSFFFVRRKSRRRWAANGSGWRHSSPEIGGGLFILWLDLLIGCFDFIFSLYNFLKWVRCQLMNDKQKGRVFYNDRTAAALIYITFTCGTEMLASTFFLSDVTVTAAHCLRVIT
jgi:hypothetical protein